jgi:LAO/AO transport system kinase
MNDKTSKTNMAGEGSYGLENERHKKRTSRRRLSVNEYVKGVLDGNRAILAQTITLVESNSARHRDVAQEVLKQLLPHTEKSIRIGISGVPGAGKSTMIESFGSMLCDQDHRVAVLAVDPSSSVTKGSILGDKTRMEQLSRNKKAFVRPSPTGGTLGGVTRKSRETMLVCEAAGFDVIIVETVGTGQSEIAVRSMVDFFLLIMLTGGGDELQGMKKGIIEIADTILVNKADGDNKQNALNTKAELNRALHFLKPVTKGWTTRAYPCSALTGEGIPDIWKKINHFRETTIESGVFKKRRSEQMLNWVDSMVKEELTSRFYNNKSVKERMPFIKKAVVEGEMTPTLAVRQLLNIFDQTQKE